MAGSLYLYLVSDLGKSTLDGEVYVPMAYRMPKAKKQTGTVWANVDALYPEIAKSWATHWPNLRTIYEYPPKISKVIYFSIAQASKKWAMPIQNWRIALNRFMIEFGDRLSDHQ